MSSYWRSPYKETNYTSDNKSNKWTEESALYRPQANNDRPFPNGHAVYPIDWFHWPVTADPKFLRSNQTPNVRSVGGKIKGILKTSTVSERLDLRNVPFSESRAVSVSGATKKRVTFGVTETDSDDADSSSIRYRYNSESYDTSHQRIMKVPYSLDELAKQNLRKLIGSTEPVTLPPVKCKSITLNADSWNEPDNSVDDSKNELEQSGGQCYQNGTSAQIENGTEKVTDSELTETSTNSRITTVTSVKSNALHKTFVTEMSPSRTEQDDAMSKQCWSEKNNHVSSWAKTVHLTPKKRPLRFAEGRHLPSSGTQNTNSTVTSKAEEQMQTVELTKLHINGDGKIISSNSTKTSTKNDFILSLPARNFLHKSVYNARTSRPMSTSGRLGFQTTTNNMSSDAATLSNSAPPSVKATESQESQDASARKIKASSSGYLNKASQIMTWLKDVQQKDNFIPRNARSYALESQQLH